MRRSSQINQANLFAVLMGEKRRNPLVRRALVSKLYPYFFDERMSVASSITNGGAISEPYTDDITFGSAILLGGVVKSSTLYYTSEEIDSLGGFSSMILTGGIIKSSAVRYTNYDVDNLGSFSSVILAGGQVKTVAIRYNSALYDTENLGNFSSTILTGGSVGA